MVDPATGGIIDCAKMTVQCDFGVCIAVYQAEDIDGRCQYQQKLAGCQPLHGTTCGANCTAESSTIQNGSSVQCCCRGKLCNRDVRLPSTCRTAVHHCADRPGHSWNGTSERCEDIDECKSIQLHNAGAIYRQRCPGHNMECVNTIGSYECRCVEGFQSQNNICLDIDECSTGTHGCNDDDDICRNTDGSYMCGKLKTPSAVAHACHQFSHALVHESCT